MPEQTSKVELINVREQIPNLAMQLRGDLSTLARATGKHIAEAEANVRTNLESLRRYVQKGQTELTGNDKDLILANGQSMIATAEEYLGRLKLGSESETPARTVVHKLSGNNSQT